MNPKSLVIALMLSASCFLLRAQRHTYFNLEMGPTVYQDHLIDEGTQYIEAQYISLALGATLEQEIVNKFSIESGVNFRFYESGETTVSGWSRYSTSQTRIPIRLNYVIWSNRYWTVSAFGGYHFVFDPSNVGGSGFSGSSSGDSAVLVHTGMKQYGTWELGLKAQVKTISGWEIGGFVSIISAFQDVGVTNIDYIVGGGPMQNAQYINKGTYLYFGIKASYPLSNLWKGD